MKRKFTVLMLCLAMIFVCSCQNSGGSDDLASGPSLVSVSFDIDSYGPSYAVSVAGGRGTVSDVYYKANPKWTNGDAYGKVTEWTEADLFSGSEGTLGLFAQGQWQFDIQVRSENGAVLYTGTKTEYINAGNHALTFNVTPAFDGTGSITVDVTANRVVASGDKLVITYGPTSDRDVESDTTTTLDDVVPNGSSTATVADFDVQTINNLAAGMYWVKLEYKNGASVVGAATVDLTLDGGETAAISGTINYGEFQTTTLTINGLKTLQLEFASNPAGSEVESDESVTFTCSATPSNGSSYQWYVNGVLQTGKTEPTFTWTPSEAQYANISCSVVNGSIAASVSKDFTVIE